ncbi:MAG: WXG100 family type VII secretion target [Clostridiales bacterium]|nr:WXG100 family type VII secretion target [Clostridiales bacterium]
MALIEVTISELQGAASKISKANETFREAAAAVKSASEALAGTWEGTSRDAFVAEQQEIDNWYKMMAECVAQYVESMNAAASAYQQTDSEAAQQIRNS